MANEFTPLAFPSIGQVTHNPDWLTEEGMSLRDYFAAKAMQGMLSLISLDQTELVRSSVLASNSYDIADAMLEARKQ